MSLVNGNGSVVELPLREQGRLTQDPSGRRAQCLVCGAHPSGEHGLARCGDCLEYLCAYGACSDGHKSRKGMAGFDCVQASEEKRHALRKAGLYGA